jgi:hypothetical protein
MSGTSYEPRPTDLDLDLDAAARVPFTTLAVMTPHSTFNNMAFSVSQEEGELFFTVHLADPTSFVPPQSTINKSKVFFSN